jgi:acetylornithine deacetylase
VDSLTQIRLTRELIDIDSTTGQEGEAGRFIAETLRGLGYLVEEQAVSDGRFNVIAAPAASRPAVVFSTHFDCVPPFFPSREEQGRLHGRGSCDAKGTLVAQVAAAERLRASGESRAGLLFVVGEERGSDGAKIANTAAPGSQYLINGEPTDNRLAVELGESAIDKLMDALIMMRDIDWPVDPVLGRTFYSVGLISGGIAPNVISPSAEAELMFRTVGDHRDLRALIEQRLGGLVEVHDGLVVPPVSMKTTSGFESAVFAFTTDIPFLDRWGTPLLIGPGSVALAHTADEYVAVADLHRAVDLYADLAQSLLSQGG